MKITKHLWGDKDPYIKTDCTSETLNQLELARKDDYIGLYTKLSNNCWYYYYYEII